MHNSRSGKRQRGKLFYSTEQYETIERAKRCRVTLESTYRDNLALNTTYLVGKTLEGQMFLLSKQLLEQADATSKISREGEDEDDDDEQSSRTPARVFQTRQTTYTSQGNVVTCITGSFDWPLFFPNFSRFLLRFFFRLIVNKSILIWKIRHETRHKCFIDASSSTSINNERRNERNECCCCCCWWGWRQSCWQQFFCLFLFAHFSRSDCSKEPSENGEIELWQ